MNEPYQRVHSQEESNSTIGTIARNIGINMSIAGAIEASSVAGAKYINSEKHPALQQLFYNNAYSPGMNNKFLRPFTAGSATKTGRIVNYGTAIGTGLMSGLLTGRE